MTKEFNIVTRMYMNRETGELLNYSEMMDQFAAEYDGDDPTNIDYLQPQRYYDYVGYYKNGIFHKV